MKNKITLYLFVLITSLSSFYLIKKESISFKNIISALEISGVSFSKESIKTMLPYLKRNLDAYKEMRNYPLENNDPPALKFMIKEGEAKNLLFVFDEKKVSLPKNKEEIAFMTVGELSYLIKNKKITSTELTKIYLERIKKYDPKLNSVITLTKNMALSQAKAADKEISNGNYRGLLHGIPYGIKDLASFPGYPTTWGGYAFKKPIYR